MSGAVATVALVAVFLLTACESDEYEIHLPDGTSLAIRENASRSYGWSRAVDTKRGAQ